MLFCFCGIKLENVVQLCLTDSDDWRRKQGFDIEDSLDNNGPYQTEIKRDGNKITMGIKGSPETYETLNLSEPGGRFESFHRLTGKNRNKPCPCGSGIKYKKCHGSYKTN